MILPVSTPPEIQNTFIEYTSLLVYFESIILSGIILCMVCLMSRCCVMDAVVIVAASPPAQL